MVHQSENLPNSARNTRVWKNFLVGLSKLSTFCLKVRAVINFLSYIPTESLLQPTTLPSYTQYGLGLENCSHSVVNFCLELLALPSKATESCSCRSCHQGLRLVFPVAVRVQDHQDDARFAFHHSNVHIKWFASWNAGINGHQIIQVMDDDWRCARQPQQWLFKGARAWPTWVCQALATHLSLGPMVFGCSLNLINFCKSNWNQLLVHLGSLNSCAPCFEEPFRPVQARNFFTCLAMCLCPKKRGTPHARTDDTSGKTSCKPTSDHPKSVKQILVLSCFTPFLPVVTPFMDRCPLVPGSGQQSDQPQIWARRGAEQTAWRPQCHRKFECPMEKSRVEA